MITKLLVATNNAGKVREIVPLLDGVVKDVLCLKDLADNIEIPETEKTFQGNARLKSVALFKTFGLLTLADDSGLEVDALEGAPGVFSARYSGENATDDKNNTALLLNLRKFEDPAKRSAQFRCVMSLTDETGTKYFEGKVRGTIAFQKSGDTGFGYDPLFIPDGYDQTFATLGKEVKSQISHRSIALGKVIEYLKATL